MPQIEQKVQDAQESELPEQMFPDLNTLEVFLEEVERLAPSCAVSPQNTRRFVDFLRDKYGKGIPESRWKK